MAGIAAKGAKNVASATEKMLLGRAKSCRWQVFVRRRPQKGCPWGRRKDLIGMHKFVVCVRCFVQTN